MRNVECEAALIAQLGTEQQPRQDWQVDFLDVTRVEGAVPIVSGFGPQVRRWAGIAVVGVFLWTPGTITSLTCGQLVPQPLSSQPFAMFGVLVTNPAFNHPCANLASSPCTTDLYMRI